MLPTNAQSGADPTEDENESVELVEPPPEGFANKEALVEMVKS